MMKEKVIKITSLVIIGCTVLSLISCGKGNTEDFTGGTKVATKASTSQAVEIVNVPTEKEEILKMFNSALDYVDVYCYGYTKTVQCNVHECSLGALSSVSNAYDAFSSIFGKANNTIVYDYETDKELFESNFMKSGFTADDIKDIKAEQNDNKDIIINVTFTAENNPSETSGQLHKLCSDYLTVDKIEANLKDFDSSASSVSISAYDIGVTATINSQDSRLTQLVVYYKNNYILSGVKLVKIDGAGVSGLSDTKITYSDIG